MVKCANGVIFVLDGKMDDLGRWDWVIQDWSSFLHLFTVNFTLGLCKPKGCPCI